MKIKDQEAIMTTVKTFLDAEAAHAAVHSIRRPKRSRRRQNELKEAKAQARAQLKIAVMTLREVWERCDRESRA